MLPPACSYETENIWYTQEQGHEEIFAFGLAAAPVSNTNTNEAVLFSGVADCGGFRHLSPNEYPVTTYRYISGSFMGIDFCEANTNRVLIVTGGESGDANHTLYISNDNGITFNESISAPPSFNNTGFYGGRIYINPTDCNHFVWSV